MAFYLVVSYFLWNGKKGSSLYCYNSLHDLFVQEKNCKVVFLRIINTAWGREIGENERNTVKAETSVHISDVTLLLLCQPEISRFVQRGSQTVLQKTWAQACPDLPRFLRTLAFWLYVTREGQENKRQTHSLRKKARIRKRFPLRVEYQKKIF